MNITRIGVFASYATKDEHLWQELKNHLIPLQRQGLITLYDSNDNADRAGMDWQETTNFNIKSAQLILLLISPYYLASDYLYSIEMAQALERHKMGEATVLPILLSPVYWQAEPFSNLNLLPENRRPITLWRKKSVAFLQVAISIRRQIDQLLASPDAKVLNVWISERLATPREPLSPNEAYTLNFKMEQVDFSVLTTEPEELVSQTDSKEKGLDTEWVVYSQSAEFETHSIADVSDSSLARFSLFIPDRGDSSVRRLRIIPRSQENIHISVLIYASGELYRDCQVELAVAESPTPAQLATETVSVKSATIHASADQLSLQSHYEWQRPPEELLITVLDHKNVFVMGSDVAINGEHADWSGSKESVAGRIKIVRQRANSFQAAASLREYIDNIDPEDLLARLEHFKPQSDWTMLNDESDNDHQQDWNRLQENSQELRDLAICGYDLYNTFFPEGTPLRSRLEGLKPGCRLFIHWTEKSSMPTFSVPWGLMYLQDPDLPIDPFGFLGLRFRIHHTAHATEYTRDRSKALGNPNQVYRGNCLYWGNERPFILRGSKWQRSIWESWPKHIFIPDNQEEPGQESKQALLKLLSSSEADQTLPVLYFYCTCSIEDETGEPNLSFAHESGAITYENLLRSKLSDRPFVFMNACTTSAADPYIGNGLQSLFLSKGCSAYLGTETEVSPVFASRFAVIFFHFFYRKMKEWPGPISAGEALAQTRLFLWTHYKNIGGLLYTYINQSQLFMADAEELKELRL